MAVARSFRDGWLTSLKIDSLGNDSAELFLFRLGLKADKNGVYHGEPELLRTAVYPLQVSRRRLADVTRYRDLCARAGLLRCWTAADGRPYVQILNFRQKTPNERPQHPLPPGEPDETGQEHLDLPDPPPPDARPRGKKLKERKVSVAAPLAQPAHSPLSDDDWLENLVRMRPDIDVRAEFRKASKRYPLGFGRTFFEEEWLKKAERPVTLSGDAAAAGGPIETEPEAWRLYLKDHYENESWAQSAASCTWATMPANWRAKIYREMQP